MAAEAFIQCRVTAETKALLRTLAAREQGTESALIKRLLEVMLRPAVLAAVPAIEESGEENRDARLSVRLAPEDRLLLRDRAAARAMPAATYVSVLVRAHLRGLAPLPKEELLALKRSVAELSAIGRNLNQIALAGHRGEGSAGPGREEARLMLKVAEALRDHVKALLKANERSWKLGPCRSG